LDKLLISVSGIRSYVGTALAPEFTFQYTAATITQYLADSEMKISEPGGELPAYVMLKTKLRLSRQDLDKKIPKLEKAFPNGKVDKTDGLRISGGGWWIQVRASNTEPIARLIAEAEDELTAKKLIRTAKSILSKKSGGK
jgi:phosphomannomutase